MKIEKQDLIEGASILKSKDENYFNLVDFMLKNMSQNHAYKHYLKQKNTEDKDLKILKKFREKYNQYRILWKDNPKKYYQNDSNFDNINKDLEDNPLCVDIETAAICDLACPHCYREYIITPDKIMNFKLYKKIIDSISKMNVPSI